MAAALSRSGFLGSACQWQRLEENRYVQTNGTGIDQANGYETERQTPEPLEVPAKVAKTARNTPILPL